MIRNLLVLPSGEELFSGTVGENAITGVTVKRCVNTEEELTAGAVCAGMLEASVIVQKPLCVNAGDEVILYTVSDDGARKQEGIFIAEKPVWESANRYTLTAYDRVSRLDRDLTEWLAGLNGWPYPLLDFDSFVCSECCFVLANEQIPNGAYPVQAFSGEGITGRQLMVWAGQAAGRFCRAAKDGRVEFAWYRETGKRIGAMEQVAEDGPKQTAVLKGLQEGVQIRAVSQIKPSYTGKKSVKLFRRGRNLLDLETVGIYHSNDYSGIRHTMQITDRGIRLDVTSGTHLQDRSLWGFCIGTPKELSGKTLTVSADFTTSKTDAYATAYVGFFEVNEEPVFGMKENFSFANGGVLYSGAYKQLAYNKESGSSACTYKVTGKETMKYIAVLFAFCDPIRGTSSEGDWTLWDNIQIEYADQATAYQPYCCDEYTRSFDTVYGGRLDWDTGELTVTHNKIQSYAGEAVPEGWASNTGMLSEGAQVIYPLEEPYTLELLPQRIPALEGENCLWSDTGNTTAVFRQDYYFSNSLQFEDYAVAPVEKVQIRLTNTDVGAVYPDDPQKENAYILSGNFLLTNDSAGTLEAVAQTLYEELKDISYTPCRVDVPAGAAVDAGDIVTVTDTKGKALTVYVMERTVSGQRCRLECTGSPRRNSTTVVNELTYKALSGKILELQADIEGLRVAHRDALGNQSSLSVTVDSIDGQVNMQKVNEGNLVEQMTGIRQTAGQIAVTVQSLQDDGVKKVRTEMGYTLDDSGLQISRENEEMRNLVDHTGMYVKRNEDTVLKVNSDGVQAVNIAVENYLTVGRCARFEDYYNGADDMRTACFFTGG